MIERDAHPLRAKLDAMDQAARSVLSSAPLDMSTADQSSFLLSLDRNTCNQKGA